ncbi:MAG TPA: YqgE/AlgH family protein, partial [Chitinophagales bacterium]|nr:YqgE/AlgH family protein [Chitinophagales bacterium]
MVDDDKIWSYEYEKSKGLKQGQLLLSEPFMLDENFRRTVVLVCEHTAENGTVGLILNKPVNLRLNEVVEGFPAFDTKVYLGGPVGTDTLQFLHCMGDEIEGGIQLAENLYWGGNF